MNVLSVREGMKHVRDYVSQGNGPMVVEMSTYRYHGHSMSDPGITYRSRDEIKRVRAARDPLEMQKKRILDEGIMDASEKVSYCRKFSTWYLNLAYQYSRQMKPILY